MCGLTGIFGTEIDESSVKAFLKLAQLSSLRGEDSSGFFDFQQSKNNYTTMHKKTTKNAGFYFADEGDWVDEVVYGRYALKKGRFNFPSVIAAHARSATIGKVTQANAHPFKIQHITGMHNGTIVNDFADKKNFETDSEAVFSLMALRGEEEALNIISETPGAAFALTWLNTKDKTFNICRNGMRPLYFVEVYGEDLVFYSSEEKFLEAVLPYYKIYSKPKLFPIGTHFKFKLEGKGIKSERTETKIGRVEHGNFFGGWSRGHKSNFTEVDTKDVPKLLESNKQTKPNDSGSAHFLGFKPFTARLVTETITYPDRKMGVVETRVQVGVGVKYTLEDYKKILTGGCSGCTKVPTVSELAYFFQDGSTFLCDQCSNDSELVSYVAAETVLAQDKTISILQH